MKIREITEYVTDYVHGDVDKVIKKETKEAPPGTYFTKTGNLVKGKLTKAAKERGARETDPKDNQRSKVPPVTQSNEAKKWSTKYKKSINCNNPKGFSQKAHCAGRKKKK